MFSSLVGAVLLFKFGLLQTFFCLYLFVVFLFRGVEILLLKMNKCC